MPALFGGHRRRRAVGSLFSQRGGDAVQCEAGARRSALAKPTSSIVGVVLGLAPDNANQHTVGVTASESEKPLATEPAIANRGDARFRVIKRRTNGAQTLRRKNARPRLSILQCAHLRICRLPLADMQINSVGGARDSWIRRHRVHAHGNLTGAKRSQHRRFRKRSAESAARMTV